MAPRAKRKAILTEYCAVTEHKPSYARKLLNGNRKYRIRKARGKNFLSDSAAVFSLSNWSRHPVKMVQSQPFFGTIRLRAR